MRPRVQPPPDWLELPPSKRKKQVAAMLDNWYAFQAVKLDLLTEEEIERLLDAESTGEKRWSFIQPLIRALGRKRVETMIDDYRKRLKT